MPTDPSPTEVADALASIQLEGKLSDYRDGAVQELRSKDFVRLDVVLLSLLSLTNEVDLSALEC